MLARRLFGIVFLILALLAGQQAAARHDLKHVGTEQRHACDQCFLSAQLSGGLGTDLATPPAVEPGRVQALAPRREPALPALRLAFRSRAPPASS